MPELSPRHRAASFANLSPKASPKLNAKSKVCLSRSCKVMRIFAAKKMLKLRHQLQDAKVGGIRARRRAEAGKHCPF